MSSNYFDMRRRAFLVSVGTVSIAGCMDQIPYIGGSGVDVAQDFINTVIESNTEGALEYLHPDLRDDEFFEEEILELSEGNFEFQSSYDYAEGADVGEIMSDEQMSDLDSVESLDEINDAQSVGIELLDGDEEITFIIDTVNHDGWYVIDIDEA